MLIRNVKFKFKHKLKNCQEYSRRTHKTLSEQRRRTKLKRRARPATRKNEQSKPEKRASERGYSKHDKFANLI